MMVLDFFTSNNLLKKVWKIKKVVDKKGLYRDYWKVAFPSAIEGVLLNLMLLADLIMVGSLGIENAAAVGITSQPKMILQMVGSATGVAVTAIVARRFGQKDEKGVNDCIKQGMTFIFIVYSILVVLSYNYAEKIVKFAGANGEYIKQASIYFKYIAVSIFFKVFCVVLSSAQIGVGNTKIVLISSMIGNGINVLLNYVLIFGKFGFEKMGIKGAAIATVIGNIVILVILLFSVVNNKNGIDIGKKGSFWFSKKVIKPLSDIGTNSFLEHIFERAGLFVFARIIATLGTVAMGTHHYCILLWDLYYYFGIGMSVASASFTGRKLGELRKDLAIIYMQIAKSSGLLISCVLAIFLMLSKDMIFSLFTSNTRVISLGSVIIAIISLLIIPQTQAQISAGVLRGAGDNRFIAIYSLFVGAGIRPILGYIFVFVFKIGLEGIWLTFLIDEILRMFLAQYRIQTGIWLSKKV